MSLSHFALTLVAPWDGSELYNELFRQSNGTRIRNRKSKPTNRKRFRAAARAQRVARRINRR